MWLWEVYWSILLPWYWDVTHTLSYTPVWYFCTLFWNYSFHEPSPTNNIIWECQILTPWVHFPTYFASTHLINLIHTLSCSNPSLGLYLSFWASPPQDHLSLVLHLHTLLLGSVAHVHMFCHFVCNYDRMGSYLFVPRLIVVASYNDHHMLASPYLQESWCIIYHSVHSHPIYLIKLIGWKNTTQEEELLCKCRLLLSSKYDVTNHIWCHLLFSNKDADRLQRKYLLFGQVIGQLLPWLSFVSSVACTAGLRLSQQIMELGSIILVSLHMWKYSSECEISAVYQDTFKNIQMLTVCWDLI